MDFGRLGIARGEIDFKVGEVELGKVDVQALIDPSMIILSDNRKEGDMDLLNIAKNSLMDNFRTIKWLFH